jgi:HSP20 family molecular chaperone IbpA
MATETTVPAPTQSQEGTREETRAEEVYVLPPVDIYEDEEGNLIVFADLPGVEPSELDVRVERGNLTLQGKAKHMAPGEPIYREFELTGFFRQFRLPENIDDEAVEAELKYGVLRLHLRRAESAQPRRIEVRAA